MSKNTIFQALFWSPLTGRIFISPTCKPITSSGWCWGGYFRWFLSPNILFTVYFVIQPFWKQHYGFVRFQGEATKELEKLIVRRKLNLKAFVALNCFSVRLRWEIFCATLDNWLEKPVCWVRHIRFDFFKNKDLLILIEPFIQARVGILTRKSKTRQSWLQFILWRSTKLWSSACSLTPLCSTEINDALLSVFAVDVNWIKQHNSLGNWAESWPNGDHFRWLNGPLWIQPHWCCMPAIYSYPPCFILLHILN